MRLDTIGYIHSKETFGTVDGPGIRYVLFLQGCPMRCLYCHNPDTWALDRGNKITVGQVLDDYESYRPFMKDGGITLSGGEALLQMKFVIDLFTEAKKRNIHTCLDTSGISFNPSSESNLKNFRELIAVTDLFLLDVKHIDDEGHKELTGFSNQPVLAFLKFLDDNNKDVWIRHVIVPGVTYDKELLLRLGYRLAEYKCIKDLDILPYHSMGKIKYEKLGIAYPLEGVKDLSLDDAIKAKNIVLYAMKIARTKK